MPDITVPIALLKKPIEAVAAIATGKLKDVIVKAKATSNVRKLYQKLNATQKVKTIWNVDRAVSLNSFYYPAKIRTRTGTTQSISRLDEIPSNSFVLSGTVGQGKSIFLRYLLGKEIRSGERVPILIELRRTPASGLETYVRSAFNDLLEISGHPEVFDSFAANGRLSLLLDGFDEIDPDRMAGITNEIEVLAAKYPASRVVVTSRPNTGIENSPLFDVYSVAPLEVTELLAFFTKIIPRDKELASRITLAVLASPTHVKSLASTPLLATLLTIVYRAHQRVPADFSEFYDELFQILLVRHDRSKSGYERKRKTKLSDREIQQVFEAFSYKSKSEGLSSLSRTKALELAASSCVTQALVCNESDFLTDISKVTCLLLEEGGHVEFLHQSVQEYFAARYVYSRPEEIAKRFYELLLKRYKWYSWDQVLRFLSQIDKYRASKYFFIPALERTLMFLESPVVPTNSTRLAQIVAGDIGVKQSLAKIEGHSELQARYAVFQIVPRAMYRLDWIHSQIFNAFFGTSGVINSKWRMCFDQVTNEQVISYAQMADVFSVTPHLQDCIANGVQALCEELQEHRERVEKLTASGDFMGI